MSVIRKEIQSSKLAITNVFTNKAMRRLFIAFAGSIIGDGVFSLSAIVFAFRNGGASAVGILAIVRYLAIATASPITSTFADQYDRKGVMVVSDLVRLVLVSLAAVVVGIHGSKWLVYALVVAVGVAGTAFRPSQGSILPLLALRTEEIAGANVVSSTIESVGFFAGPALAGFLLAFTNVSFSFAFDAATFVWSLLFVASIRMPNPEDRSSELAAHFENGEEAAAMKSQRFIYRAIQGFLLIRIDGNVRTLVLLYILQCVVAGASAVFTVAIALQLLHIGNVGLGLMESLLGIGGLVGGFLALVLVERAHLAVDFALGVIVWAAPLILIAIFPSLLASLISMLLIGLANSVVDVNAITILQRIVPNEKLGRVLGALEAGTIAGMALGSLLMTLLIHWLGLRLGLALIGGSITLSVLPGLPTMKRIDRVAFEEGATESIPGRHRIQHLHLHHLRRRHPH
ncbi:MAG: MFS transporter [Actinomycetota bacterium]|nr:MFS transporter [Actinomycetota bacterium]